jgi:hypothetical protein
MQAAAQIETQLLSTEDVRDHQVPTRSTLNSPGKSMKLMKKLYNKKDSQAKKKNQNVSQKKKIKSSKACKSKKGEKRNAACQTDVGQDAPKLNEQEENDIEVVFVKRKKLPAEKREKLRMKATNRRKRYREKRILLSTRLDKLEKENATLQKLVEEANNNVEKMIAEFEKNKKKTPSKTKSKKVQKST